MSATGWTAERSKEGWDGGMVVDGGVGPPPWGEREGFAGVRQIDDIN